MKWAAWWTSLGQDLYFWFVLCVWKWCQWWIARSICSQIKFLHCLNNLTCGGSCSVEIHHQETVDQTGKEGNQEDWNDLIWHIAGLSVISLIIADKAFQKICDSEGISQADAEQHKLCNEKYSHFDWEPRRIPNLVLKGIMRLADWRRNICTLSANYERWPGFLQRVRQHNAGLMVDSTSFGRDTSP